jgi:predicted NUDIX family NTP pyrophosphohydrolase
VSSRSAGVLLFRHGRTDWKFCWRIPAVLTGRVKTWASGRFPRGRSKGEDGLQAARREFAEETGHKPTGDGIPLGSARQKSGKVIYAWAIEGNWNPQTLISNTLSLEWPPRSDRITTVAEIDRACWMTLDEARTKILPGQAIFLDRLQIAVPS